MGGPMDPFIKQLYGSIMFMPVMSGRWDEADINVIFFVFA